LPTDCPHSGWPAHSPESSPEKPHTIEFLVDRNSTIIDIIDRRRDRRGETEEQEQSATEAVAAEEVAACRAPDRRATVDERGPPLKRTTVEEEPLKRTTVEEEPSKSNRTSKRNRTVEEEPSKRNRPTVEEESSKRNPSLVEEESVEGIRRSRRRGTVDRGTVGSRQKRSCRRGAVEEQLQRNRRQKRAAAAEESSTEIGSRGLGRNRRSSDSTGSSDCPGSQSHLSQVSAL
jgi:hypothetical protein